MGEKHQGRRWRKPGWLRVGAAVAVVAALAAASPAIGGPSLKKLIRKEVRKQVAKARGPAGPPGAVGAPGTARAHARVKPHVSPECAPQCGFDRAKGITSITHPFTGTYCVVAQGISPQTAVAVAAVDINGTSEPIGNAQVAVDQVADPGVCAGGFVVETYALPTGADPPVFERSDEVGFTIAIP